VPRVPLILGAIALLLVFRARRASAASLAQPRLPEGGGPPQPLSPSAPNLGGGAPRMGASADFVPVPWNKPNLAGKRILTEFPLLKPEDKVLVQAPGSAANPKPLHRLAASAYLAMVAAARADGIRAPMLDINSGFRSDAEQQPIWDRRLNMERARARERGETVSEQEIISRARIMVAPPLTSNHRTGFTVDLNLGRKYTEANVPLMMQDPAWLWLDKNALRFGFYPYKNKRGVVVEPWHWEYNPAYPPPPPVPSIKGK